MLVQVIVVLSNLVELIVLLNSTHEWWVRDLWLPVTNFCSSLVFVMGITVVGVHAARATLGA